MSNPEKSLIIEIKDTHADRLSEEITQKINSPEIQQNPTEKNWLCAQLLSINEIAHKLRSAAQKLEQQGGDIKIILEGLKDTLNISEKLIKTLEDKFSTHELEEEKSLLPLKKGSLTEQIQYWNTYVINNINHLTKTKAGAIYRTVKLNKEILDGLVADIENGTIKDIPTIREELSELISLKHLIRPVPVNSDATPDREMTPEQQKVKDIENFFGKLGEGIAEGRKAKVKEYKERIQAAIDGDELKDGDKKDIEQLKRDYLQLGGQNFWDKDINKI